MNKKYLALTCLSVLLLVSACQGKYDIEKYHPVVNQYDSSKPIAFDGVKPTYGGINNTFVVEGNFPADISKIKVYFSDKKAVLLSSDGRTVSGLVPKQLPGNNQISIVVGNDSLYSENIKFKYTQTQSVTTIAGLSGNRGDTNGEINVARFQEPTGVAAVASATGNNVFVVEGWWIYRVRMVSLEDNSVFQVERDTSYGGPLVTSNRERVWLVGLFGDNHRIKYVDRADAWKPINVGVTLPQSDFSGMIWGTAFEGDDERYMYVMDGNGNLGRVDLEDGYKHEMLASEGMPTGSNHDRSDLIYSNYHKCFFACRHNFFAVYKLTWKNGDPSTKTFVWELYAGKPATGTPIVWGNRLDEAQMRNPYSLCESNEGDIYVVHRGWAGADHSYITRITAEGRVELAAGSPGQKSDTNGTPLEARFNEPQDMCMDYEGNFYIADGNNRTIRKMTIE